MVIKFKINNLIYFLNLIVKCKMLFYIMLYFLFYFQNNLPLFSVHGKYYIKLSYQQNLIKIALAMTLCNLHCIP